MEIDNHNMVLVEEEEEEKEEVALRRSLRSKNSSVFVVSSSCNAETSADSGTTSGIEHEYPRKGANGDGCVDSETSNEVDFDSPNKGIVQEEDRSHDNVYFEQHNGTESMHGVFEMKNGRMTTNSEDADVINNLATKESLIADMNYQCWKNLDNSGFSESSLTPLEESFEEQNIKAKSFNNETKLVGDFDSLEEIDQEETELDVESVLAKQNTHDLYCPNCKSRITRRVILRRKRKFRNTPRKSNSNKVKAAFSSDLDADFTNSANVEVPETADVHSSDSPALAASDQNNDREPKVFWCLSCFNLFIPTGDGIKLSWPFGRGSGNENGQNLQKTPPTNSTIVVTDTNKRTAEQGNKTLADRNIPVSSSASSSLGLVNNMESAPGQARKGNVISSASPDGGGTSSNAAVNVNAGRDVIVIVDDPAASQIQTAPGNDDSVEASNLPQSGNQIYTNEQRSAGVTVDILKSIVYGGLIESITSLSVVSSAAGAGSATLNILALGLANLIGGLFIIGHNLIELKNYTSDGTDQMNRHEDRYKETLGRPENFPLHATVAVLSFLIFGMLSPVIYSFSFRKSDDKDLKLAVVGGVSLACILLLAIGKAHVRRPPKSYYISTALSYVISGIMASGISYVVGDLISKLMEKVGWFESSLTVSTIVPERKPIELAWASY